MVYVTVSAVQRERYGYGALCLISAQGATDVIYQYASSISRCEHQCVVYTWVTVSARARAMWVHVKWWIGHRRVSTGSGAWSYSTVSCNTVSYSGSVRGYNGIIHATGVQLLCAQPGRVPMCKYISGAPSSVKVFMNHLLSCAQVDLVLRACFYGSGSPLEICAHSVYIQRACPLYQLGEFSSYGR